MKNYLLPTIGSALLVVLLTALPLLVLENGCAVAQTDSVREQGRSVGALIAKNDSDALFALFTPQMAQAVPISAIRQVVDQVITPRTPLGARVSETTRIENGMPIYEAVYRWIPGKDLTLTVTFVRPGEKRIAGILLQPTEAVTRSTGAATGTANDGVLVAGRSVASLVAKRDATTLFRRFTPIMAAAAPESALRQLLDRVITRDTPLGKRLVESTEADPDNHLTTYIAVHRWTATKNLTLTIGFVPGSGGKIAGFLIRETPTGALSPDPHAGYQLKSMLHLPFAPGDTWTVFWGGDTREQNYHVDYPDQRHACDLLVHKDGDSHRGEGRELADYYAWGRSIVAPAKATVLEAVDTFPDNRPGAMDPVHPFGNHVVLALGNEEYAVLAHLQKGSVSVKAGEVVEAGQALGRCGNSGNSSEPHLHFHLQDKPALGGDARGLPITFVDYLRNNERVVRGTLVQLEQIASIPLPETKTAVK